METVTHPTTAWLIYAVMPALVAVALLLSLSLARPRLAQVVLAARAQRAQRSLANLPADLRPDPALLWMPAALPATTLASLALGTATLLSFALATLLGLGTALILGLPLALLIGWLLELVARQRYTTQLDQALTPAVGRLSALLRGGVGLRLALERVVGDLPEGPLRHEWIFLATRQGLPLQGGGVATAAQVITAMADQTPSRRHAAFLNHLGAAVGQPQEVQARRCEAAYTALQMASRRRDEAVTELAQMRYSGLAVGLAGLGMAIYLLLTQWDRAVLAYASPLGMLVAGMVVVALLLPILGGILLTQVADNDY
ncbi:MAG: hypothetical protein AB4911_25420 [Oscillochloridaceae bacterium umkhey_bin13]